MTAEHVERSSLLEGHADANAWVERRKAAFEGARAFGKIVSAVIWTHDPNKDREAMVPLDPAVLTGWINSDGLPLYRGHDPGFPVGRVLAAELFADASGKRFVAAILGLYNDEKRVTFTAIGVDANPTARPPESLPPLAEGNWIQLETDSNEVDPEWVESVARDAPLPVKRRESAHYAAESLRELILIGLPYVLLVWNPFVKSFATEAGKDAYSGVHRWLEKLWEKLSSRRHPIVHIAAYQEGCRVSFIFRGNDVKTNYAAHEALSIAAAQAAQLVAHMKRTGVSPYSLVYEFEPQNARWFPSYAELDDGRLVSDRNVLIALEQLPSGLSLGIARDND